HSWVSITRPSCVKAIGGPRAANYDSSRTPAGVRFPAPTLTPGVAKDAPGAYVPSALRAAHAGRVRPTLHLPASYTFFVKNIALVVHGGAWAIPSELKQACKDGVLAGLDRGWNLLRNGGSALDACEQAIVQLENDPTFDAGIGSHLNRDGHIQMDAILMDGGSLKSGAVVAVERILNPIKLPRLVLNRSEHMRLAGAGAELFAGRNGPGFCRPER